MPRRCPDPPRRLIRAATGPRSPPRSSHHRQPPRPPSPPPRPRLRPPASNQSAAPTPGSAHTKQRTPRHNRSLARDPPAHHLHPGGRRNRPGHRRLLRIPTAAANPSAIEAARIGPPSSVAMAGARRSVTRRRPASLSAWSAPAGTLTFSVTCDRPATTRVHQRSQVQQTVKEWRASRSVTWQQCRQVRAGGNRNQVPVRTGAIRAALPPTHGKWRGDGGECRRRVCVPRREYGGAVLYIAGEWRPAASGRTFASRNPATGEVIGTVADAGVDDTKAAIDAAADAFADGHSARRTSGRRSCTRPTSCSSKSARPWRSS